jgi:hypothetical protein
MLVLKKSMDPNFEPIRYIVSNGHDPVKVQKFDLKFCTESGQTINFSSQNMCSLLPWYTEFPICFFIQSYKGRIMFTKEHSPKIAKM